MSYQLLLARVAAQHGATPADAEREMIAAMRAAGIDMRPEDFIASCAAEVKRTIYRKSYNT